jgi:hypothetical protein
LVAELGSEPHTPIDDAVRSSLVALGCLAAEPNELEARASAQAVY